MPWIDLDEAKAHLNKTSTNDDGELEGFIPAACAAIEDIVGHVDVVTVTELHRSPWAAYRNWRWQEPWRRHMIELLETPVLAVTSVVTLAGNGATTAVPANNALTGSLGWELLDSVLYVPSWGNYQVTYTAGRNPVPENYRLAALELIAHLWRGSQLNQSSGRPQLGGDQMMVVPHVASAMPYRVRELLGLYGNVVNNHVVIA